MEIISWILISQILRISGHQASELKIKAPKHYVFQVRKPIISALLMQKHSYRASGNTLVELNQLKWSLCVAELQLNNHFHRGYALGYHWNMKRLGAGISYYRAEKDNFYSSEATAEERANTRLTMELLIENEDRYKARAKYLLKNHLFQMRFGDDLVEYYINDGQVTFSIWNKGSNGFQNLVQTGLSRRKKDRIAILVDLFATSEARIILNR